jgi:thiamine biosynthesis protein ThiS
MYFEPMQVTVNGEPRSLPEGIKVDALLAMYKLKPEGVVVELNLEVPAKSAYSELMLREGDRIEIVKFMGGG